MSSKQTALTLTVKLINGTTFQIVIQSDDTVGMLRKRIASTSGYERVQKRLCLHANKKLLEPDSKLLRECDLKSGDCIYPAVLRACCGTESTTQLEACSKVSSSASPTPATTKEKTSDVSKKDPTYPASASPVPVIATTKEKTSDVPKKDPTYPTDVPKARAAALTAFGNVFLTLRGQRDGKNPRTSLWPRSSQVFSVYERKSAIHGNVIGMMTQGLSDPYDRGVPHPMGITFEILMEVPADQALLGTAKGETVASYYDSLMFRIMDELAHHCHHHELLVRTLIDSLKVISMNMVDIALPGKYFDPRTGRCSALVGHLDDPEIPRGFDVSVPLQNQWIDQTVLILPVRLLTYQEFRRIEKGGESARYEIVEEFKKNRTFSITNIPLESRNQPDPILLPNVAGTIPTK